MKKIAIALLSSTFTIIAGFAVEPAGAPAPDNSDAQATQIRFESRLNELMLWKLSDELGLKAQEEQQLKALLKKYQEQRKDALKMQESSLEKMSAALKTSPKKPECQKCLDDFQKSVAQMAAANTAEFKDMKTLLGQDRLAKFLVIRSQMTRDVRDALRQPALSASTPATPLKPGQAAPSGATTMQTRPATGAPTNAPAQKVSPANSQATASAP